MKKENIKFTNDGKKVVVIGNLNSQEKIVQEIFIINDCEIPSGEHFVVNTLHDSPAISWKEKELKKLEERYEQKRSEYTKMIESLENRFDTQQNLLRAKLEYVGLALKNVDESAFTQLIDYITGKMKWIVTKGYIPTLIPIAEFIESDDNRLRLVTLFGKDDGTFTYYQNHYYDGSGCSVEFEPFHNFEEAFEEFKKTVKLKDVNYNLIKIAHDYNFELLPDKLEKFKERERIKSENNINKAKEIIESEMLNLERLK